MFFQKLAEVNHMNAKMTWVFLVIASMLCAPIALAQETTEGTTDSGATTDTGVAPADSTESAPAEMTSAPADSTTTDASTGTDAGAETTATSTETAPAEGTTTEAAPVENGNLEEALSDDMSAEETQAVAQEIAAETQQVSYNLPGPFSRALAKVGDWVTFDPEKKAARGLARAEQNKIRILQRMMATGTGFARSPKWSAEMQKLQQDIEADMKIAEEAIASSDGSSEQDLEAVSQLNEELNEQQVLDATIAEAAQETVEASSDLSSEELQTLNSVAGDLAETTTKVKGKAKKELLETAGKLVAKGKSIKDLKAVKDKTVKHKELREKAVSKATEKKAMKQETVSGKSGGKPAGQGSMKSDAGKSAGNSGKGKGKNK